jgi:dephospho-CoA kinase
MKQAPPIVLALTGGIGSGKSSIATLFAEWGAAVVDADELAREVVSPGSDGLHAVIRRFGTEVLHKDNSLNRKKLGQLVFSDPQARTDLEQILHPLIRQRWLSTLETLKKAAQHPVIVYAVPLLFESGNSYQEIDKIVLVTCRQEIRIKRICQRDKITEADARARITTQLPDEDKAKRSDYVVRNDGSLAELTARAREVWDEITGGSN